MKVCLFDQAAAVVDVVDLDPLFVGRRAAFFLHSPLRAVSARYPPDDERVPKVRKFEYGHLFEQGDEGRGVAYYYEVTA